MNMDLNTRSQHAASDATWQFSLAAITDKPGLEHDWKRLEAAADAPFFLSWAWIGCWLDHVGADRQPQVLRVTQAGSLVGLGLVVARRRRWLGLLPGTESYLHETGDPALDSLTIEYNGLLVTPALRPEVTARAVSWLLASRQADAVHLSGVPAAVLDHLTPDDGVAVTLRDQKPTYQIDLDRIRTSGGDFITTLSSNTRSQLRRPDRQFAALGPIRLVEATALSEAEALFEAMIPLHQDYWRSRGRPGAFASPPFVAFHRQLIRDGFPTGAIQLVRCDAGTTPVGYLYNFVRNQRVYSYQSGFNYDLLPRSKPGWLCHHLAIEHNLQRGMTSYDLLAGASQFKASFAAVGECLVSAMVERAGWRPTVVRLLREAKHSFTLRRNTRRPDKRKQEID